MTNGIRTQKMENGQINGGNSYIRNSSKRVLISRINKISRIRSSLKVLNTNAQSLQFKMDELKDIVNRNDIKLACITETWSKEWNEAKFEIDGFDCYKKHRLDGRKGGESMIYVNKELKSYPCREMENVQGDDTLWCWVKISGKDRILVGCIYRSSNSSV